MSRTIEQRIEFDGVKSEELFEMYVDARKHTRAIGAPVTISREIGGTFAAFGERMVRGKNLLIKPSTRVVQTWRAQVWKDSDPDSVLVLTFMPTPRGAAIELVQTGIPDGVYDTINDGWNEMYWKPWKEYLRGASR